MTDPPTARRVGAGDLRRRRARAGLLFRLHWRRDRGPGRGGRLPLVLLGRR